MPFQQEEFFSRSSNTAIKQTGGIWSTNTLSRFPNVAVNWNKPSQKWYKKPMISLRRRLILTANWNWSKRCVRSRQERFVKMSCVDQKESTRFLVSFQRVANEDLRWERTRSFDQEIGRHLRESRQRQRSGRDSSRTSGERNIRRSIKLKGVVRWLKVETYGSMERREKLEFLLEQMRLCLGKEDYIRTQIISKKINTKSFDDPSFHVRQTLVVLFVFDLFVLLFQELKLKFYSLMIEMDLHEKNYFNVCQHYKHCYETPRIRNDANQMKQTLKFVVLYLTLSPFDNEQSDLLHRLSSDKNLELIPKYKFDWKQSPSMFDDRISISGNCFNGSKLKNWFTGARSSARSKTNSSTARKMNRRPTFSTEVFRPNNVGPISRVESSNMFVVSLSFCWEHCGTIVRLQNIRVISKYYTRIRTEQLANLLELNKDQAEEFLSNLVSNKTISAKIDRLEQVITFQQKKSAQDILNEWSFNLNSLMTIINKTCHLINKEETVHAVKA